MVDSPSVATKIEVLKVLLSQILCGVESSNSAIGRLALLTLKSFAGFYKKITTSVFTVPPFINPQLCAAIIKESREVFLYLSLSSLLNMLLPLGTDGGTHVDGLRDQSLKSPLLVLRDRTDTFASAMFELILMDSGERYVLQLLHSRLLIKSCSFRRLHGLFSEFISRQTQLHPEKPERAKLLSSVRTCFEKLFSDRAVSLTDNKKSNERNFILNMRECLPQLQVILIEVA